jgi:hypothetical protein
MDVHTSPASLPELDAFLSTFEVHFVAQWCFCDTRV